MGDGRGDDGCSGEATGATGGGGARGTQIHVPKAAVIVDTHELGEEIVTSYLYQIHLYHWLEANDHGRYLADNDL